MPACTHAFSCFCYPLTTGAALRLRFIARIIQSSSQLTLVSPTNPCCHCHSALHPTSPCPPSHRLLNQLGTTGFVNAHLEDETPLFQKSRINLDSLGRDEKVVQMVAASGTYVMVRAWSHSLTLFVCLKRKKAHAVCKYMLADIVVCRLFCHLLV